jgi:ribosomal protein S27AE
MTLLTLWAADEPCPDCGTALVLADDGTTARAECRACGHADTWTTDKPDGGNQ